MFGVLTARRGLSALLLALVATTLFGLIGCGGKEEVDPYVYDSLRRVIKGDTLSVNFLFEIDAPKFEYVRGDVGMIRDGNLLEFLVAKDLEDTYPNLAGTLLGVKKTFTPQPTHLVLKRIKRNGVIEADSLPTPQGYVLPKLLRSGQVDLETPGAPLPDLGWKTKDIKNARAVYLPENEGDDLKAVQSGIENFVYVPKHDLPEDKAANPGPEDYAWYAVFPNAALEIVNLDPGADWMLHLLKDQDYPLVGSFSLVSLVDEYSQRKIEHPGLGHVVGTMQINWFKFANSFIQGTPK